MSYPRPSGSSSRRTPARPRDDLCRARRSPVPAGPDHLASPRCLRACVSSRTFRASAIPRPLCASKLSPAGLSPRDPRRNIPCPHHGGACPSGCSASGTRTPSASVPTGGRRIGCSIWPRISLKSS
ncbi:hypothetical protein AKJ39_02450 [candidate division MSBL1 archaeon SCGC-AAA259J03]|uniref:Uncharacterized protein n=1 Tax=candidate division MSBL1 archaeon SCGC-AAA259J03 TaxID=1698269 RepID=A0A656YWX6_9EURY|nr:hypothetical protein AKJ39_02450 [candidate division MSBL1 archaeon SCGC-AAA259J03]